MEENRKDERVLHNYFRSSSSYRVRIALNLKGLPFEYAAVHLNRNGGEQFQTEFKTLNPQGLVPVLRDQGLNVSQSLAILEYLEEKYPHPPLLPQAIEDRAYVRQLALAIACEIHPISNLRVLKFLTGTLGLSEESKGMWVKHWTEIGLSALESELAHSTKRGRYCFGDVPTIADCCLVPQLFNARRFAIDLSQYPTLTTIDAACQELSEFQRAHPQCQPDSE
ncbi:maleylpyruvate isomerase [Collimonas sp. OK607]|uniref:maleylacetoacetate isomerase n=1 Tax=Collimonas sp. OK607 TaxID=1798194 RepID=UPI0008E38537|nr:maleylacetoacetate isomerase [Collimonas sp. OK607]SFB38213.1 maleylpyruvate isomerase [Collimonas sp. OK607]